jgi:hypothetical protein
VLSVVVASSVIAVCVIVAWAMCYSIEHVGEDMQARRRDAAARRAWERKRDASLERERARRRCEE